MKKIPVDDPVRLKHLIKESVEKSVRLELKQSKKRAQMKKKLKKLKRGGLIPKEAEEEEKAIDEEVADEEPVEVKKKAKKRKRKNNTDVSPKAKKQKPGFEVSDVPQQTQCSPVGAKILNGSSEPELELPAGWIVEPTEKTSELKENEIEKPKKKSKSPEKKKEEPEITPDKEQVVIQYVSFEFLLNQCFQIVIKNPHSFFQRAIAKVTPRKALTPQANMVNFSFKFLN